MLNKIEGRASARVQRDDFAVNDGIGRKAFARARNIGEVFGKRVAASGPQVHAPGVFAGEAAVAVEFDLVDPFVGAVGQLGCRSGEHRFDKFYPRFGQACEIDGRFFVRGGSCCGAVSIAVPDGVGGFGDLLHGAAR